MTAYAIPIIWCTLQVTLLCVVGGVFYLVVRKAEPRLAVPSIAILLGLVAVLSLTALSPWPRWQLVATNSPLDSPAEARTPADAAPSNTSEGSDAVAPENAELQSAGQPSLLSGTFWMAMWDEMNRPARQHAADPSPDGAGHSTPWPRHVLLLLCVASGVGGLRLAAACHALRRLRRKSVRLSDNRLAWLLGGLERSFSVNRPIQVRETAQLSSAATIGWRRPIILLPAQWRSWPQEELRAVLAHELAHIAARDWPTWLVAQVTVALHFYHPLVHWLAFRLRLEQELAADAAAAAVTGRKESYLGNLAAQMLRADQIRPLWATQTFLPTRSTIVRRIEMLKSKSPQAVTGRPPGRTHFAIVTALLAIGLAVAGIRMPPAETAATALAQQPSREPADQRGAAIDETAADATADIYARYAEPNGLFFAYLRPREIFASDEMAPLRAQFNQMIEESIGPFPGLKVEELEAFGVSPSLTADRHEAVRFVLTFVRPVAEAQLQSARAEFKAIEQIGKGILYSSAEPGGPAVLKLGDHTLILDSSLERLKSLATRLAAEGSSPPKWLQKAIPPSYTPHLWAALNMDHVRAEFAREKQRAGQVPPQLAALTPLIEKPHKAFVVGNFAPDLELSAVAVCETEEDAQLVTRTAQAFLTLARNMIAEQRRTAPPEGTPQAMIAGTLEMADRFLRHAKVETVGNEAQLTVAAGSVSQQLIQMGLVLPAIQASRQAAQRTQSMNNLKQLALAMFNYNEVHGHFPPAVLTGPDGKSKYSWRVAILPFLEQAVLYDEYRMTEPWDSEHNRKLIERMPDVFRSPTEPANTLHSAYYVLVGDKTVFDSEGGGTPIKQIRDGTSNTLLIVEAKRPIPWTKPEDIPYSADQPLPELGGYFEGIFLAAFADASVQIITQDIDQTVLRRMIEKADGQPVRR